MTDDRSIEEQPCVNCARLTGRLAERDAELARLQTERRAMLAERRVNAGFVAELRERLNEMQGRVMALEEALAERARAMEGAAGEIAGLKEQLRFRLDIWTARNVTRVVKRLLRRQ